MNPTSRASSGERAFRESTHAAKMSAQRAQIHAQSLGHSQLQPHPEIRQDGNVHYLPAPSRPAPPQQHEMRATDPRRGAARRRRNADRENKRRLLATEKNVAEMKRNMTRKIIWGAGGPGGAAECEGAAGGTWFGLGGLATVYQAGKAFLKSKDDPDLFGKDGVLTFFEPPRPDPNDGFSYVVYLYAIGWTFAVVAALLVLIFFLTLLAFSILVYSGMMASIFGILTSFLSPFVEIIFFL